jgi:hypothetical protein
MLYIAGGLAGAVAILVIAAYLLIDANSFRPTLEAENQKRIAINQENYEFTLIGYEAGPGGPSYVLSVNPKTRNKYLFQGRIWVDAEQFAVVRIEGEPAKNPSFWIKEAKIETLYQNVNEFLAARAPPQCYRSAPGRAR